MEVPPCPDGCWVVLGEGYNSAWRASAEGADLGEPTLIDGNANGWWLEPTDRVTQVEIDWPIQRRLNIAFALTALATLACLALVLWHRRRDDDPSRAHVRIPADRGTARQYVAGAAVSAVGAAVFIDWVWAVPATLVWLVAAGAAHLVRRPSAARLVGAAGATIVVGAGLIVTQIVRTEAPFPDAGWPVRFEWLHPWTLLGVVLIVASTLWTVPRPIGDSGGQRADEADG